ncbi:PucR family transcriptional regulator [Pseudonocardia sp. TMWB2A]|uniref:PucR family transcriptional regulator n=1 Tax=Pseudonocardia sp. TMWB2A TaxID=687430 RepID=UPI00307D6131
MGEQVLRSTATDVDEHRGDGQTRFRLARIVVDDVSDLENAAAVVVRAFAHASVELAASVPAERFTLRLTHPGPWSESVADLLTALADLPIRRAVVLDDLVTGDAVPRRVKEVDDVIDRTNQRQRATRIADLWPAYVIDRLRESAAEHPYLLRGPVDALYQLDAVGRSEYVRSLSAYFDHSGDIGAAATSMFMHPNTLRYRLRRMQELTSLDLSDPMARLVAEMQLRIRGGYLDPAGS